jgi:anti-sigma B factor antagonist
MELEKHMHGDVTVVSLDGQLHSGTAAQVQGDMEALLPQRGLVLLDLSRMSYMSSAGLRVLLLMYRQAQRGGTRLTLTGVQPDVRAVMAATGFLEFFTVADTVERGLAMLVE